MKRPSFDQLFMGIALWTSKRSSCMARQVGATIVQDKRVLATGYNGAPVGVSNCHENNDVCPRREAGLKSGEYKNDTLCPVVHSEENAILQAAKNGININGASMFVMAFPCPMCAKAIINSGIKEVVYAEDYNAELSKRLFAEAGIKLRKLDIEPVKEFMKSI